MTYVVDKSGKVLGKVVKESDEKPGLHVVHWYLGVGLGTKTDSEVDLSEHLTRELA